MEAQVLALKRYCEAHGIIDYQLHTDEGVSGAKTSRPGLDALLAQATNENVTQVITYSLSRLSRSTSHLLQTLERLQRLNIRFVSITEAIDLATPSGRLLMTVLGAVGEMERALVVERVKCGLENARSKGKRLGAPKKIINAELLLKLSGENLPYHKIGRLLGCSAATVCRELKRLSQRSAS